MAVGIAVSPLNQLQSEANKKNLEAVLTIYKKKNKAGEKKG